MADITDNKLPLQSLVQEVEKEEGRGRPTVPFFFLLSHLFGLLQEFLSHVFVHDDVSCFQVVKLPEPLCLLMSNKSYNWCKYR